MNSLKSHISRRNFLKQGGIAAAGAAALPATLLVNHPEYREVKEHLRELTEKFIVEAGEAPAKIEPSHGTY